MYTAFLFGQAEGRDLWQSTLLPLHLVVQGFVAGSATLLVMAVFVELAPSLVELSRIILIAGLIVDLMITSTGRVWDAPCFEAAAKAAHAITHGRYKWHYWLGNIIAGHLLPLVLLLIGVSWLGALAGVAALIGLYLYEYAFVMAPQEIANS